MALRLAPLEIQKKSFAQSMHTKCRIIWCWFFLLIYTERWRTMSWGRPITRALLVQMDRELTIREIHQSSKTPSALWIENRARERETSEREKGRGRQQEWERIEGEKIEIALLYRKPEVQHLVFLKTQRNTIFFRARILFSASEKYSYIINGGALVAI